MRYKLHSNIIAIIYWLVAVFILLLPSNVLYTKNASAREFIIDFPDAVSSIERKKKLLAKKDKNEKINNKMARNAKLLDVKKDTKFEKSSSGARKANIKTTLQSDVLVKNAKVKITAIKKNEVPTMQTKIANKVIMPDLKKDQSFRQYKEVQPELDKKSTNNIVVKKSEPVKIRSAFDKRDNALNGLNMLLGIISNQDMLSSGYLSQKNVSRENLHIPSGNLIYNDSPIISKHRLYRRSQYEAFVYGMGTFAPSVASGGFSTADNGNTGWSLNDIQKMFVTPDSSAATIANLFGAGGGLNLEISPDDGFVLFWHSHFSAMGKMDMKSLTNFVNFNDPAPDIAIASKLGMMFDIAVSESGRFRLSNIYGLDFRYDTLFNNINLSNLGTGIAGLQANSKYISVGAMLGIKFTQFLSQSHIFSQTFAVSFGPAYFFNSYDISSITQLGSSSAGNIGLMINAEFMIDYTVKLNDYLDIRWFGSAGFSTNLAVSPKSPVDTEALKKVSEGVDGLITSIQSITTSVDNFIKDSSPLIAVIQGIQNGDKYTDRRWKEVYSGDEYLVNPNKPSEFLLKDIKWDIVDYDVQKEVLQKQIDPNKILFKYDSSGNIISMIGSNGSPDINSLQWKTILSIKESIIQNEKYIRMFNPSGALAYANEYGTGINLAGLTFTPDTKAASVNGYQYQDTQGYLLDKNGSRISLEWAAPLQNGGALAGEYFDFIEHKSTYSGLLVPTSSNGTPLRNTSYFNYELFQRHYKENTFLGLEKIYGGYLYNDNKGFYYLDNRFGDDVTMAYNENSSWFKASVDLAQIVANTGKAASPDARKAFYDFAVTSYSPGENANYINGTSGTMPYCYNGHGGFVCNPGITGIQKLLAMTISGPFSQFSTLVNIGDLGDKNTIIGALIYSLTNLGFLTSSSIKMPESYTLIDTTKLMSAISTWGNELGVKFVAQTGTDSPLFKIINTLKPAIEALPTQLDLITKTAFIVSNFGVGGTFYPRVTFGIGLVVKF